MEGILLASENEKLRAATERQMKKRNQGRSSVAKGGILTVAEAHALAGGVAKSGPCPMRVPMVIAVVCQVAICAMHLIT